MRMVAAVLGVAVLCGCSVDKLRVQPSKEELSPQVLEYAENVKSGEMPFARAPIRGFSAGKTTYRHGYSAFWLLLFVQSRNLGNFDDEYAYQTSNALFPFYSTSGTYVFDIEGKRLAGQRITSVGVLTSFLEVVSFKFQRARIVENDAASRTDFGFFLLRIVGGDWDFSLLRLSTTGIDFLFIPFWRVPITAPDEES